MRQQIAQAISETDIDYYREYRNAIDNCNEAHNQLHTARERIEELENELQHQKDINRLVKEESQKRINTLADDRNKLREENADLKKLLMNEWRG